MTRASKTGKALRCAIYTRKSTEHGLELEFNSLDAQREACEAYIKSQAAEGWQLLPRRYDDPAYSGGNLERPALRQLIREIEAGQVDVVVVYKIDRLTRSLADFAKLVELFDAKSVSFVAVTQQFNTTTSMGRLTLNVLLSFAQFERELASERVRDKIAASRRKGKWTGGNVPLGYDSRDKKLLVNPAEARTVQLLFERYLALGSFQGLIDELAANGTVTKRRTASCKLPGGAPFTYGSLAYLLKNRLYRGEVRHGALWFPGEHEPIIERDTFERVQQLLKTQSAGRTGKRRRTGALLCGLIYDDRGNRMSPSFSVKKGVRYPFYVSSALLRGRKAQAGTVARVSATKIEAGVILAVRRSRPRDEDASCTASELLERFVARVAVKSDELVIDLKGQDREQIRVPWTIKERSLSMNEGTETDTATDTNSKIVQAIVRAHAWLRMLSNANHDSIDSLARAEKLDPRYIQNRIRLAFLPPAIMRSYLRGTRRPPNDLTKLAASLGLHWTEQLDPPKSRQARNVHYGISALLLSSAPGAESN